VNRGAFAALERAPRGQRAFLYLHYIDVHDYRFAGVSYAEAVQAMDAALGELLAGLEERGFLEGAVVILTSDHGERLGEDHAFPGELPNNTGHYGNPSFEELLRIPLLVAPPVSADGSRLIRTQDLGAFVLEIAGLAPGPPPADTRADELFVGEMFFRTYREGRYKTTLRRADGRAFLYDLESDPQERRDLSNERPLVVLGHRKRLNALSAALAAAAAPQRELSDEDRERLRALGYLEREAGAAPR
jgi:arylsulfatase A-like enzyme